MTNIGTLAGTGWAAAVARCPKRMAHGPCAGVGAVGMCEVPGVGPWTAHGFLLIALDRPDVFLPGDLALRRGQAGVRLRPRTNRTGDGLAGGALASVSKLGCGLSVRV